MSDPVYVGWRCNELLMQWNGQLWLWTKSPQTRDDAPHTFRLVTAEEEAYLKQEMRPIVEIIG